MKHGSTLSFAALLGVAVSLSGCGILKKKQPDPAASVAATATQAPPPAVTTAAPVPVVPAAPALDEASIPAPQDFEDEAFEKVTAANFKAELTRLTREITAPPVAK
jgi:hypothetical protein